MGKKGKKKKEEKVEPEPVETDENENLEKEPEKKEPPATSCDQIYVDPRYGKMAVFVEDFEGVTPSSQSAENSYNTLHHSLLGQHMLELTFSDNFELRERHLKEIAGFHEKFKKKTYNDDKPPRNFTTFGWDFSDRQPGACDWTPEDQNEEHIWKIWILNQI